MQRDADEAAPTRFLRDPGETAICIYDCVKAFRAVLKEDWCRAGNLGWRAGIQESALEELTDLVRADQAEWVKEEGGVAEDIDLEDIERWRLARGERGLRHGDILCSARGETLILDERGALPELLYQACGLGSLVPLCVTAAVADPIRFYGGVDEVGVVALCPVAHRGLIGALLRKAGSPVRLGQILKARLYFEDRRLLGPKWVRFAGPSQYQYLRHLSPRLFVKTAADGWVDATED